MTVEDLIKANFSSEAIIQANQIVEDAENRPKDVSENFQSQEEVIKNRVI